MKFTISISSSLIILLCSFSSVLFPMDPPRSVNHFQKLPLEVLRPLLITLPAIDKNNLRLADRNFSILLSREHPQFFMFCKELNASKSDKVCLGIEMVCSINENNKDQVLHDFYATNFQDNYFQVIGEYMRIIGFNYSNRENPQLILSTTNSDNTISIQAINPAIIPFLTCNMEFITTHCKLNETKNKKISIFPEVTESDIELLSSFLVQYNDASSLEFLRSQGIYRNLKKKFFAGKLLQLALFCASEKVIPVLIILYQAAKIEDTGAGTGIVKDTDYLRIFFNKESENKKSLLKIVKMHHADLTQRHSNRLNHYHACLQQIFKEKDLAEFNPPVIQKLPEQSDSEKKEKKSKKKKYYFWK